MGSESISDVGKEVGQQQAEEAIQPDHNAISAASGMGSGGRGGKAKQKQQQPDPNMMHPIEALCRDVDSSEGSYPGAGSNNHAG